MDPAVAQGLSAAQVRQQLASHFKSTAFVYCAETGAVTLSGSTGTHLQADPDLAAQINDLSPCSRAEGFDLHDPSIDQCLEDGLSGMFIARQMAAAPGEVWGLLHLDDHADMMATLLVAGPEGLRDPETDKPFRATDPADWEQALARGSVTIGSYLTAILSDPCLPQMLHIRHLRPVVAAPHQDVLRWLHHDHVHYPILGSTRFANVTLSARRAGAVGSYLETEDAHKALAHLPVTRLLVHIDLDFFINDFNGNPGGAAKQMDGAARAAVLARMDQVFDALRASGRTVARWIIATSPGFCAVRHWAWLLASLARRIALLGAQDGAVAARVQPSLRPEVG